MTGFGDDSREPAPDDDPLERGIKTAFGLDPEADAPTARSVLRGLRESGGAPEVALRDPVAEPSPVALPPASAAEGEVVVEFRYQIAGEIARGGVGSVLKARDVDLGRDVALKVLLDAHRGNPEMTRRFLEEAQIAGQLEHPGVVPVHDIGVLADERPYFAMKLVKGQTLAELLKSRESLEEGRLRFLGIFEQVSQTLAYAHTRGVIHRDLKPSNVMVGAFGEVQVMDWGLAKVLPAAGGAGVSGGSDTTRLLASAADPSSEERRISTASPDGPGAVSIAGAVMGTPAYMPPEQARGAVDKLDERADVFGLGAILCEILTGKPPYTGKSFDEVLDKANKGALDDAFARLERCGAGRELAEIARICIHPVLEERPRNALVVAKRVRAYLESIERRAGELQVRAAKTRLKLVAALLALALVLLGGGAYLAVVEERREQEQAAAAAVREALGRTSELRSQAIAGGDPALWDAALKEAERAAKLAQSRVRPALAEEAAELRARLASEVRDQRTVAQLERLREDEERESDPEELAFRFGEVFASYGIDVASMDAQSAAQKVRESAIRNQLVLALDQWAVTTNRFGPERRVHAKVLEIAQLADDDPWRRKLRQAVRQRDREQLEALAEEATTKELAPSTLEVLATSLWDPEKARVVWTRAQELHPGDFWINLSLGDHLRREKAYAEALQYVRAAAALRPTSPYALYKLGSCLAENGALAEGLAHLRRSIVLEPHPRFGSAYYKSARILAEAPEKLAPQSLAELAAELRGILESGREHHHDGLTHLLAETLFARGERAQAILLLEHSLRARGGGRSSGEDADGPRGPFPSHADVLERMRAAVAPDLVSFSSVDAALEAVRAGAQAPAAIAQFEARCREAADAGAPTRLLYLEGRRQQAAGEHRKAADTFAAVIARDDSLPEPFVRLAESLRAAGEPARAEAALREALGRPALQYREPWKLWAALSLVDLGRSANQALASFPALAAPAATASREPGAGFGADLRWALERLAAGEPLRINCGGDAHVDSSGIRWEHDCFFTPDSRAFFRRGEVARSGDAALRRTWRRFQPRRGGSPGGYEVPLPAGRYQVTLHLAEAFWRGREREEERELDVTIEGQQARVTAVARSVVAAVADGSLDVYFTRLRGGPSVCAIEVRELQ